ncbi:uncharacterized protein APUU_41597S [Aspergillus puulaauensis]|uniref:Uncharacterized protein n=1 Tax=Aspergillus puulaauensis TaxID=1220207 RepID=A0A7R7XQJ9_9EURO|nr:uncharacterized protein APUU_41597S [Aspergillus puulaauensis]BCS25153.1 hypothetical protein APUU_41597S [Aspergillus puulaauensis]
MSTDSASPPLEVRVVPPSIPASFTPPVAVSIQLSVLNHAESPVTVLNWGSPLDPRANILGVFEIRDSDSDELVTIDTVKFTRKLPPPREDFVQIPTGGTIDTEVTLPRVPLVEGHRYTVQARGWWQAVWEKPLQDVPADDLEKLTGAKRGEFRSEAVPITVAPE